MNLLFVAGYLPAPPTYGPQRRVHAFLSSLSREHHIRYLAVIDGEADHKAEMEATRQLCAALDIVTDPTAGDTAAKRRRQAMSLVSPMSYERGRYDTPRVQTAIARALARERVDAVVAESMYMAYAIPRDAPAVVLDEHNIEYELAARTAAAAPSFSRRAYGLVNSRKLRREAHTLWRRSSVCTIPSEREEAIIRAGAPGVATVVVPNGVDTQAFTPARVDARPPTILFFGSLNYRPNVEGIQRFVAYVMPILRQLPEPPVLRIVGPTPAAEVRNLASADVHVVGLVPDVRVELARASVVVVPLRAGGGTRLKILEAMAMARPVVSTSIGAEGIAVTANTNIVIADDDRAFADAVTKLLRDPAKASAIGEAGRHLVESFYDWRTSVRRFELALNIAVSIHRPALATSRTETRS